MKQKLIIIRGNSGSGKSSIARALQRQMGYGTAWIEQDYIRRTLLRERDGHDQPYIELIALNARFALAHGYDVIIEGILYEDKCGEMLRRLADDARIDTFVYYLDVSFDEALHRHQSRPQVNEFGEEAMRSWFTPHDYLDVKNEYVIPEDSTFDATLARIMKDISV